MTLDKNWPKSYTEKKGLTFMKNVCDLRLSLEKQTILIPDTIFLENSL